MSCFAQLLHDCPEYNAIRKTIEKKKLPMGVIGLPPAPKAHLIHALCDDLGRKAFVVMPDEASAVRLCADLVTFGTNAVLYPARDFRFYTAESVSRELEQKRIGALTSFLNKECDVLVFSAEAAVQNTIPPEELRKRSLRLKPGAQIEPQSILYALLSAGYSASDLVEGPGQFASRGGLLDFFPPGSENPIRIEFWGDEIDSVSYFDAQSQRRGDPAEEIRITPSTEVLYDSNIEFGAKIENLANGLRGKGNATAKENLLKDAELLKADVRLSCADKYLPIAYEKSATLLDYAEDALLFVCDSFNVKEKANAAVNLLLEEIKELFEDGILCKGLDTYCIDFKKLVGIFEEKGAIYFDNFTRGSFDTPVKDLITFNCSQGSGWDGSYRLLTEDIDPLLHRGYTVLVLAGTEKAAEGLFAELEEDKYKVVFHRKTPQILQKGYINVLTGAISYGIDYPGEKLLFVTYSRMAGKVQKTVKARKKINPNAFNSLDELHKGDYVVHEINGIGIFDGIEKVEMNGFVKDYIKILYAKNDVLYVPVTKLDLVSKYIGPHEEDGKRTVKINRLGSPEWMKTKSRVKGAVKDMAEQLVRLYAQRQRTPGFSFSPDIDMQNDFERRFEFDETEDQLRCIDEIKGDMEKSYPMDRLLCGDVGFGKTEVALRAAFKCAADGKQCAILVPTTILALQHYRTILRRFEGFPLYVDMISRFRTPKQQTEIKKKLATGSIDILVGTHKLLGKEIKFRDLGLLIIDEEQRFGVAQKEKLKELFPAVDVLTLSATPIPRTLNMALTGIRDMSVIEEAPLDRFPVQTYVIEHDMGILEQAISKELRRGGQVFYLYNKTSDITARAKQLQELFPDAVVAYGHGKMPEETLSDIWRRMTEGEIDILVCTTIIETGVDVPNANTLIIEDADRLGLAQLHQIRGRVGRSTRRASAYLTFRKDKELTEIARRRLDAIREYTEFGSGFRIAMRDMEIRGTGNLIGAQQHGHLESVGYDMFIKLLAEAIDEQSGNAPVAKRDCQVDIQLNAHIPDLYISSYPQRLAAYRRIADIRTQEDAMDVTDEFIDRYGEPPESVLGLIKVALLKNACADKGIFEITQRGNSLLLFVDKIERNLLAALAAHLKGRVMASAAGKAYFSVKLQPNETSIQCLEQIVTALETIKEEKQ
ncbi:MAG: transcription-repair coupling factor [Ruminococcaceae bacterium]|nr:transcription-repair coupling factor [Oscillospiraceae bacterium]